MFSILSVPSLYSISNLGMDARVIFSVVWQGPIRHRLTAPGARHSVQTQETQNEDNRRGGTAKREFLNVRPFLFSAVYCTVELQYIYRMWQRPTSSECSDCQHVP